MSHGVVVFQAMQQHGRQVTLVLVSKALARLGILSRLARWAEVQVSRTEQASTTVRTRRGSAVLLSRGVDDWKRALGGNLCKPLWNTYLLCRGFQFTWRASTAWSHGR